MFSNKYYCRNKLSSYFEWNQCLIWILLLFQVNGICQQGYPVEAFGAVADGVTDNTYFIQQAIDSVHQKGGGKVTLRAGVYLSGTLFLKSHVFLEILPGAILKAKPDLAAFPLLASKWRSRMDNTPWSAFIRAVSQEHIGIIGGGLIHGSGDSPVFQNRVADSPVRPYGIFFEDCQYIHIEGVRMEASAYWMQRYYRCSNIVIRGIKVLNHVNLNNDGLDIDSSSDVVISDCIIDSSDDALVIKSESSLASSNIVVSNCLLATHASAIKLGTGSVGGFKNIIISNVIITPSKSEVMHHPLKLPQGMSGIDLTAVDGGNLEEVIIKDVIMEGLENAIHIRLGNRGSRDIHQSSTNTSGAVHQEISVIKNVRIQNIIARDMGPYPIVIYGFEGHPVRNVTLQDISITQSRSGESSDIDAEVNWEPHWYPFILIYNSRLPAYGIVTHWTEGLVVERLEVIKAPEELRLFEWHYKRF